MVLTNPHMKPRIEFIIMKKFIKIVKTKETETENTEWDA